MSKEVVLRFVGDAGHLNRTFREVDANAGRAMDGMQGKVAGATAAMSAKFGAVGTALASTGASAKQAGARLTRNVTLPLAAIGALGIKTAMDYEKSMNILQQASGASEGEMSQLASLAQKLGADLSLPGTSASDAALAMTELAKAGLNVNEIMGATKGVLQLSAAGGLDNATSATVAANALNAFGLEGKEASRVADLLAGAANGSSADVAQLADSLSQGASVFAQAGIPIEDFVTSAALLANVGIKGSDAGTSLKSMMLKLQAPSKQAAGMMRELGIDIYDAQGRMKPFGKIIENFTSSMAGLTQEERDINLGKIFGSDAIRSANGVLLAGLPAFNAMKDVTTKQGAAAAAAAAQNKGLAGALDAIRSSMETLAITVVAPLLGGLAKVATAVAGFVTRFGELPKPVQVAIAAFAGLLVVVGPLAWLFGAISTVVSGLAVVLGVLLSPVALIIAGIAALAVGLYLAYQRFETFRNVVDAVFNVVRTIVTAAVTGIVWEITTFVNVVKALWDALWNGLGGVVTSVFGGIVGTIKAALDTVIATINKAIALYNKLPSPDLSLIGGGAAAKEGGGSTAGKIVGGAVKTLVSATPLGGIGDALGFAKGGALLGVNRPTPVIVGEGHGKEDMLAVPHSKGGLAGMRGNTFQSNFYGVPLEEAMERTKREQAWRMALVGRR